MGQNRCRQGKRQEGYNVIKGFYAQHQLDSLVIENEILEELKQAGSGKTEQELRNVLGCFLFSDEDVFKKIKVLSGGEKSRVALAKTLISEANFLLLDEPTNHLDFQSENILIQALQQYKGTFVIVSHNRHFISQTANKVWYIEDREIKEYPGTYEEFHHWYAKRTSAIEPQKEKKKKVKVNEKPKTDNSAKKLQDEIKTIEGQIETLENEVQNLEKELSKKEVYSNVDLLKEATEAYEKAKMDLDKANTTWESLIERMDTLDA